jgi:mersacidin/lichenicidin family type 2 lantibiotic
MEHFNIIRAWKDPEFRRSLTETEGALLPANPAGLVELAEEEMNHVAGAPTQAETVRSLKRQSAT